MSRTSARSDASSLGGELFLREIGEQPAALRALLTTEGEVAGVAREIARRPRLVRLVGHGSSDNAASYAGGGCSRGRC